VSANVMGTNREVSAGADSFEARKMASTLSKKIPPALYCSLVEGLGLRPCDAREGRQRGSTGRGGERRANVVLSNGPEIDLS
jgi:hypothetical protein